MPIGCVIKRLVILCTEWTFFIQRAVDLRYHVLWHRPTAFAIRGCPQIDPTKATGASACEIKCAPVKRDGWLWFPSTRIDRVAKVSWFFPLIPVERGKVQVAAPGT